MKMAKNGMCFSMLLFLLCFISGIGSTVQLVQGEKTWCIAKPSTDEATLLGNLNYACSQVDCSVLQRGKPCFNPDNLISHASLAMNLYYQSRGRNAWNCNFKNSALVVLTDPSYGGCVFA
ncbi:Carbohydrate-binding X8 domain superfamily protein [Rhynchospora pubera]|uniref:Carbohydrate-binding X8 domain superfamily protein n=1 Tax=Rhynchospora pubera TaxID=906938 RepID=A0AAV8HK20_9POAL|nr:Carbohydrate-binding X8 domain superfamily protein [Rhynchospora pubera]KAJ4794395.1 Carbohydrate-binding X8 domain superfamily protein [Rhynchospora pubera]KAJ4818225.1 Carbohydrate-binding X8 domain superfamily protein [Rhynchospora pubera]